MKIRPERLPEEVQLLELKERHELAQRVFFWREARGWSQEKLADSAGMTQAQVAHLEAGHSNPTLRTLVKVAVAFGSRVHDLLTTRPEPRQVWTVGGNLGPVENLILTARSLTQDQVMIDATGFGSVLETFLELEEADEEPEQIVRVSAR